MVEFLLSNATAVYLSTTLWSTSALERRGMFYTTVASSMSKYESLQLKVSRDEQYPSPKREVVTGAFNRMSAEDEL